MPPVVTFLPPFHLIVEEFIQFLIELKTPKGSGSKHLHIIVVTSNVCVMGLTQQSVYQLSFSHELQHRLFTDRVKLIYFHPSFAFATNHVQQIALNFHFSIGFTLCMCYLALLN